jgi:hypothetical protein
LYALAGWGLSQKSAEAQQLPRARESHARSTAYRFGVRRTTDVDRLRAVAAIPPTGLAEPVRRLASRTLPSVVLIRITRITGGIRRSDDRAVAAVISIALYEPKCGGGFGVSGVVRDA